MELIEITRDGNLACEIDALPEIAVDVMASTAELYRKSGYEPPWVGYLALDGGQCVGTCAFKSPPVNARVEIAYFTFPSHEGRGVATTMARNLVKMALAELQEVRICAQTLPEHNASTHVLEKLGFKHTAVIDHSDDGTVWEWELGEVAQ